MCNNNNEVIPLTYQNTINYIESRRDAGELSYAAFAVGDRTGTHFRWCLDGTTESTLFDMASVTKIAVTTSLFLLAQSEGRVHWNHRIGDYFDAPADKADIPLWRLLTHSAGFRPYFVSSRIDDPAGAAAQILSEPLLYTPGERVVYCCNGFNLLGKLIEGLYGDTLDVLFREKIAPALGMTNSGYKPPLSADVALHQEPRHRVNDENAFFMGNVAGNAGLFSNIVDMSRYAAALANGLPTLIPRELFCETLGNFTPGLEEARGIGWKLVDPGYIQTGRLYPVGSYGHCGHTGQCVFVGRETGMWTVFLTNMTYFHRDYSRVCAMRGEFHNAVAEDLGL